MPDRSSPDRQTAFIENRIFDDISIGDSATLSRTLAKSDIELFAVVSGDTNPAHIDDAFAANDLFHHVVAHGMWGGALISAVLGTELPGPGTIYVGQTLRFHKPVGIGDTITTTVTAREKRAEKHEISFDCRCVNQHGREVITGSADVIAPTTRIRVPRPELPHVQLGHRDNYRHLIEKCSALPAMLTGVVHPCDAASLSTAVAAARAGLIIPVLIGPEARIKATAEAAGLDISAFPLMPVPHSHAAAAEGVRMARAGEVAALMKGSLHTDELMHEVASPTQGLRTACRISHAYIMDIPTYAKPLMITDAAINIAPTLADKRDICQNAIDLARALGVAEPNVAILAAVETVTGKMPSTLDAAALCKMADRRQITGARLDGPLAFDNAISAAAAADKGIVSSVAGNADILLVPDLEAGNMLAKQLTFLANAEAAGIVLGARVPIILTSRADSVRTRMASCAVAAILGAAMPPAALGSD
jgi:phosphotransacetylase/acyl dehydratase